MTLPEALTELSNGKRIQRAGWAALKHHHGDEQGMWIEMVDQPRASGYPPIAHVFAGGKPIAPWPQTVTDKAATDWQVVA